MLFYYVTAVSTSAVFYFNRHSVIRKWNFFNCLVTKYENFLVSFEIEIRKMSIFHLMDSKLLLAINSFPLNPYRSQVDSIHDNHHLLLENYYTWIRIKIIVKSNYSSTDAKHLVESSVPYVRFKFVFYFWIVIKRTNEKKMERC